jgi:membrane protein implicated in regulation of membrane protease activity
MSMTDRPTRGPARRGPYVIVGVLIAIGIVVPLLVPTYASATPTFIGLPFFYWYQMLWVLISTALTVVAYKLWQRDQRDRKGGASK